MTPNSPPSKNALGNVLVTGGCGMLGGHIIDLLLSSYICKLAVVDLRTTNNRRPDSSGVKYYDGDITDITSLTKIFETVKPDVVIHTASPNGNDNKAARGLFYKVNVEGTKCVIEACQKNNVKALVYTSSASIISNNVDDLINADERWPVLRGKAQSDYYSETKAHADELVLAANRQSPYKLLTCSIRPAGLFGEGDPQLVPAFLRLLSQGKDNFQVGDNNNLFDFTYTGNVAHAHALAAVALLYTYAASTAPLDHEKVDGEGFLITNGSPMYFWDMPRMLWQIAGSKKGTEHVWVVSKEVGLPVAAMAEFFALLLGKQSRITKKGIKMSCMTRYYNINKARTRLGYKPLYTMQEGAQRAVKWFMEDKTRLEEKKT